MKACLLALTILALGGAFAASCGDNGDARSSERPQLRGSTLIALGDSIAAGNGATDPATGSFAAVLASRRGLELRSFAVSGADSAAVLSQQVPAALPALTDDVTLVVISAGGNDLAGLIPNAACTQDPLPPACPLEDALAAVERNMASIIDALRDERPQVPIALLAYPNFFSGTGHAFEAPAGRVLPQFGAMLEDLASRYDRVVVAKPGPKFESRGQDLTGVLDPKFDPHPNDAGHRVIADAFDEALRGLE